MIKCKKTVCYELSKYPEKCKECPAFSTSPYACQNERGEVAHCELGYMAGQDMRDFSGYKKYSRCRIEQDKRVIINELL